MTKLVSLHEFKQQLKLIGVCKLSYFLRILVEVIKKFPLLEICDMA